MAKEKTFAEFIRMAKAGLTEEQILTSGAMKAMFLNIATFVTGRYKRRCIVRVKYTSSGDDTAATDGDVITIDTNTSLLKGLDLLDKVKGLIGMIYHECGHILFTDFKKAIRCRDMIMVSEMLIPEPVGINETVDEAYKSYQKIAGKVNKNVLVNLWQNVQNIVEDGAIENFLRTIFPGYAGCLNTLRGIMFEQSSSVDEVEDKPGAMMCFLLEYATCHKVKGELATERFDLTEFADKTMSIIDEAVNERDSRQRIRLINAVYVLVIEELFKDIDPESGDGAGSEGDGESSDGSDGSEGDSSDSGSSSSMSSKGKKTKAKTKGGASSGSSGSGSSSADSAETGDDESSSESGSSSSSSSDSADDGDHKDSPSLSDILSELEKAMEEAAKHKEAGSTTEAKGRDSSSVDIKDAEEFNDSDKPAKDGSRSETDDELEGELESVKSEAIKEAAEGLAEDDLKKTLAKSSGSSEGIPFKVIRPTIPYDAEEKYQTAKRELMPAIKTASRLLAREIEDRKLGEIQHGKVYGKSLDQTCLCRLTGGKMQSSRLPEDKPDMAVMCLIDESGSMSCAGRIPAAINAAFVVNGFCKELSLPLSIYGHSEQFRGQHAVEMRSYKEFDFDGDQKAAKRLMGIDARENNRDGFAIRFCADRLKKRDEHIKLLLIVSDGAPSANHYEGAPAIEDTRRAVAEAKKAGITVVTAGIGGDSSRIREVYQDSSIKPKDQAMFLDVSNPQDLSKELVKILKRNVRMAM